MLSFATIMMDGVNDRIPRCDKLYKSPLCGTFPPNPRPTRPAVFSLRRVTPTNVCSRIQTTHESFVQSAPSQPMTDSVPSSPSDTRPSTPGIARRRVTIINSLGLHARPAALFVQVASRYDNCEVRVAREHEEPVNGKSIMGLMMLAAAQGTVLEIEVEGPSSDTLAQILTDLISNRFGEE